MKLNKKSLFSFLVVFTLIICVFAVSAFAEGEEASIENIALYDSAEVSGDNWSSSEGVLTLDDGLCIGDTDGNGVSGTAIALDGIDTVDVHGNIVIDGEYYRGIRSYGDLTINGIDFEDNGVMKQSSITIRNTENGIQADGNLKLINIIINVISNISDSGDNAIFADGTADEDYSIQIINSSVNVDYSKCTDNNIDGIESTFGGIIIENSDVNISGTEMAIIANCGVNANGGVTINSCNIDIDLDAEHLDPDADYHPSFASGIGSLGKITIDENKIDNKASSINVVAHGGDHYSAILDVPSLVKYWPIGADVVSSMLESRGESFPDDIHQNFYAGTYNFDATDYTADGYICLPVDGEVGKWYITQHIHPLCENAEYHDDHCCDDMFNYSIVLNRAYIDKLSNPLYSTNTISLQSGNYVLTENLLLAGNEYFKIEDSEVNLCLNGFSIIKDDKFEYNSDHDLFSLSGSNAILRISDCSKDLTGKVQRINLDDGCDESIINMNSGSAFILYSGEIGGMNTTGWGAVNLNSDATFIMNGGAIRNNHSYQFGAVTLEDEGATFIMNGGSIDHNSAGIGGGVFNCGGETVKVVLNGGVITENEAAMYAGGVFSIGELILNGTEIYGNKANEAGDNLVIISGLTQDGYVVKSKVSLGENFDPENAIGVSVYEISGMEESEIKAAMAELPEDAFDDLTDEEEFYLMISCSLSIDEKGGLVCNGWNAIKDNLNIDNCFFSEIDNYEVVEDGDEIWLKESENSDTTISGTDPVPVIPGNIPDPVEPVVLDTEADDTEPEVLVNEVNNIEDGNVALAENPVVEPSLTSTWSLVNVALAVLSLAGTLTAIIGKKENLGKIAGSASTIGAAITLLLTSNFAGNMVMTDKATILMAAFAAVSAAALIIKDKKEA